MERDNFVSFLSSLNGHEFFELVRIASSSESQFETGEQWRAISHSIASFSRQPMGAERARVGQPVAQQPRTDTHKHRQSVAAALHWHSRLASAVQRTTQRGGPKGMARRPPIGLCVRARLPLVLARLMLSSHNSNYNASRPSESVLDEKASERECLERGVWPGQTIGLAIEVNLRRLDCVWLVWACLPTRHTALATALN